MTRNPNDLYRTPVWAILPLCDLLTEIQKPKSYYEPYASDGQITSVLASRGVIPQGCHVELGDIDPQEKINQKFPLGWLVEKEDCTARLLSMSSDSTQFTPDMTLANPPYYSPDLIVANPPYCELDTLATVVFELYEGGYQGTIALLLRRSALEPTDSRGYIWEQFPPKAILELPRFSMKRGASGGWDTDSTNMAWMVWCGDPLLTLPPWSCVTRKAAYYTRNPEQEAKLWGYTLEPQHPEKICKNC